MMTYTANTVKPPNKDMLGTHFFVLCREVVLFWRLFLSVYRREPLYCAVKQDKPPYKGSSLLSTLHTK